MNQQKTIQMTEGVEDTISRSISVSQETSFEIFASFKYFGGIGQTLSSEWTVSLLHLLHRVITWMFIIVL